MNMARLNMTGVLAALMLLTAACGFTPVHAPGGTGQALYDNVLVQAPNTKDSYFLVRHLEERIGRGSGGEYRLDLTLETEEEGQALTLSNVITRYSIVGVTTYALVRVADDVVVTKGTVENFTGYSATGSTVDTFAGERDARERLMVILADQISSRLYATQGLGA